MSGFRGRGLSTLLLVPMGARLQVGWGLALHAGGEIQVIRIDVEARVFTLFTVCFCMSGYNSALSLKSQATGLLLTY